MCSNIATFSDSLIESKISVSNGLLLVYNVIYTNIFTFDSCAMRFTIQLGKAYVPSVSLVLSIVYFCIVEKYVYL